MKSTAEEALSSREYLAKQNAVSKKEDDFANKLAKLRSQTLQDDVPYQKANDKFKAATAASHSGLALKSSDLMWDRTTRAALNLSFAFW